MGGLLISLLDLFLQIAVVLFVAFAILWFCDWMGFGLFKDARVYKAGQAIVALIILILALSWLFAAVGWGGYYHPWFFHAAP